ncbi:MAG: DUF4230 domain-containing protein [Chloroflexi bacterium]|nr:DUF4230 domain-containing protein [Chloroflexota bacterium]
MIAILKFIGRHFITIALVVIALIVGGFVVGSVQNVRELLFPQTAVKVNSPIIMVNQIKAIAQLVTVSSDVGTTNIDVEIHRGFLNSGYYSASHIAIGAIDAGINFDEIEEDSIDLRNDVYTITLPASIITSCRIEYINQNQYSITLLPADWDLVRQIAESEALDKFAQGMIEEGVLVRAAEEASRRIGKFVMDLTGLPANIEFRERSEAPELPDSCKPIPPSGWEKDVDGGWRRAD